MEVRSTTDRRQPVSLNQRDRLGLIMGCAVADSASFSQAMHAAYGSVPAAEARTLTRELLSDLSIRGWIELRSRDSTGGEVSVPRIHYELELADDRNWDEASGTDRTRYALTERGRAQVGAMLADLRGR